MFITFEGGEGSGKSTQIKFLAEYLRSKGKKVLLTFEPGGTRLGRMLRKVLLNQKDVSPVAELLLFAADRAEHVESQIKKALNKGYIVLCDRYIDSTIAYQSGGRKLPPNLVEFLSNIAADGILPDLTILLDLPAKAGLKRAESPNKFEKQNIDFHNRVRKIFLERAEADPERIKVVNASRKIELVKEEIRKICSQKMFGIHS